MLVLVLVLVLVQLQLQLQLQLLWLVIMRSWLLLLSCTSDRLARLGHTPHPQGIPPDFSVATDSETEVGVGLLFGRGGWLRSTDTEKS